MNDPVTPQMAEFILMRDRGCVAALVFGQTGCKDVWGKPVVPWLIAHPKWRWRQVFQIDHVLSVGGRMGKRAESDAAHLWCLCAYHHEFWARKRENRVVARQYLKEVNSVEGLTPAGP